MRAIFKVANLLVVKRINVCQAEFIEANPVFVSVSSG